MLPMLVAITTAGASVPSRELDHVAAALQVQATRDLGPLWSLAVTVERFASLDDVPVGYWPLVIVGPDDIPLRRGFHTSRSGQPLAVVEHSASWSLVASHEMVEMCCNPSGQRITSGRSPKRDQGQVQILVEACDPCQAAAYGYTINGVLVSDFVTPRFYDPASTGGTRYSFAGHVQRPRQVLPGGYMSWRYPRTGEVWQEVWEGSQRSFQNLGVADFASMGLSFREWVDEQPDHVEVPAELDDDDIALIEAREAWSGATEAAQAQGAELREELKRFVRSA